MIAGRKGKPQLLFVSPVIPNVTGNGMAMRAGIVLMVLARDYDVSLLATPMHGPVDAALPAELAALCRNVSVQRVDADTAATAFLSAVRVAWPSRGDDERIHAIERPASEVALNPYCHVEFEVVHVFRLTALPYAAAYLDCPRGAPELHLDLDETESFTRKRLAALYRTNGEHALARFAELEAGLCEKLENEVLARFDRLYVCSETERLALRDPEKRVAVLPNALPERELLPPKLHSQPFSLLFVGTLAFYQNEDAVLWLCREVLPLLRERAPRFFEIVIVGLGATERVRRLADDANVRVVGPVNSLEPWYARADAVVVPVRAAGGTRIKVLEAMSYGRPIISTPDGVEGFEMEHEKHVLIAPTAERFADQCVRLMEDAELAASLARNAHDLFLRAHTPEAIAAVLARTI